MIGGGQEQEHFYLIDRALNEDKNALETLLTDVQDMIFNLSLRFLGTIHDAEDATQEILIRLMTNLSRFRKESTFKTWVFKIAVNYLKNCKKSRFAQSSLSFEIFSDDIRNGNGNDIPSIAFEVDKDILSNELKLSCTNVMLQCLDPENRWIFILGTMFKLDSRIAGDILNMKPETYRQRLSRARKKMAGFLTEYCGHDGGMCDCRKRLDYAASSNRLDPDNLEYTNLTECDPNTIINFKSAMEQVDDISMIFNHLPAYRSPQEAQKFIVRFMETGILQTIQTNGIKR